MGDVGVFVIVWAGIVGFVASIVVGNIAARRGWLVGPWFLASLFFTPVVALLMLIAVGEKDKTDNRGTAPRESGTERRQARRSGA